jgi:serine/threonine-protein kinase HipA
MNCKICLRSLSSAKSTESPDYHDACKRKLFGKAGVSPRLGFDKKQFSSEIAHKFSKRMSMSGLQQKLSMKIESGQITPTDLGGTLILKPTSADYDDVSENEHVSMLIGQRLGIDTPPCGLVSFSNGELAYIIRRFDRLPDGSKIHQEDLTQILGLQKDSGGEFKYGGSYESAGQAILNATGNKLVIALRFFERVVLNFLIGNADYHLKNISLRNMDASAKYSELTPNYDSLNTFLHFGPGESFFALKDGLYPDQYESSPYNELGSPSGKDFIEFGSRLGLKQKVTTEVFAKFSKKKLEMRELIDASYLAGPNKDKYKFYLEQRFTMLSRV